LPYIDELSFEELVKIPSSYISPMEFRAELKKRMPDLNDEEFERAKASMINKARKQ